MLNCPECGSTVHKGGHARGKARYHCNGSSCVWHGQNPVGEDRKGLDIDIVTGLRNAVISKSKSKSVRRYVVTSAQNATRSHAAFLNNLLAYCELNTATLLIIPYRYKNPTSIWSKQAEHDDWWDDKLTPYLIDRRVNLCKGLVLLADIKTQPTAVSPLNGLETVTGTLSAIVGHPRIEFCTVATPQGHLAKILTSTGAATVANYIPSKAGKKGEHHHTFGACVIEIESDETFHIRQLVAIRDGSFQDLEWSYSKGVRSAGIVEALIMGDTHEEFLDSEVATATFHPKTGIIAALKPKHLVWHDLHDFYSRNHHHKHETFINYVKHHSGADNVEKALNKTFAFVDSVTPSYTKNIFVSSNHPAALEKWVKGCDPHNDPENCVFWARTFEVMCLGAKMTDTGAKTIDPFAYWGMKKLKTAKQAKFLGRTEGYLIKGIEVGYHGHQGTNGARGSRASFAKIATKTVIGHGHSPGINAGCYQVGLNARYALEYVSGPSSWMQTDCLIYSNGKRTLISIINGKWRA